MSIATHPVPLGGNTPDFLVAVCQHSGNVENPQFSIHVQTNVYRKRHSLYAS